MEKHKYFRKCPSCGEIKGYKSKQYLKYANKINSICRSCHNKNRSVSGPYTKECSSCGKTLLYTCKATLKQSLKENWLCRKCNAKKREKTGPHTKLCPHCFKTLSYSTRATLLVSRKKKWRCRDCADIWMRKPGPWIKHCPRCAGEQRYRWESNLKHAERINQLCGGCKDKKHNSKYWVRNCNKCGKSKSYQTKSGYKKAKERTGICIKCINKYRKLSPETKGKIVAYFNNPQVKKQMRLAKILQISINKFNGHQVMPGFNPEGCRAIDEYGKKQGYKFQHAMNGGEFHIKELGYWVDGYDFEKNVVIEYDEPYHREKKQRLKDIQRQKEITDFLGCKFIRIESTK